MTTWNDISGTIDSDFIIGTGGNDRIVGGRGDDAILGGAGGDILRGQGGDDLLLGGDGDDLLVGGLGADALVGGAGNDVLELLGNDQAEGGVGNDTYLISQGTGFFYPAPWNAPNPYLYEATGEGVDTLRFTDIRSDEITIFQPHPSATYYNGLVFLTPDGNGQYNRFVLGEVTFDTFYDRFERYEFADGVVWDGSAGIQFESSRLSSSTLTYVGTSGTDTFVTTRATIAHLGNGDDAVDLRGTVKNTRQEIHAGVGNDVVTSGNGITHIYAGSGRDLVKGGGGFDSIRGEDGNDRLSGGGGGDYVSGGNGNDSLFGGGGKDRLYGGNGKDRLSGNAGNDDLRGEAGHDALNGGRGNDRIEGGTGDDRLSGGTGRDTFVFTAGDGSDRITDFQDDIDTIDLNPHLYGFATTTDLLASAASQVGADVVLDFGADGVIVIQSTLLTDLVNDFY